MDVTSKPPEVLEFGRFMLLPQRRELMADGRPAHLGGRALDLLMLLIEARGLLVTKQEILNRVWPGTLVDESNVHTQISALRKVLGADAGFIRTDSGRGYRFVAQVTTAGAIPERDDAAAPAADARSATNLPAPISDLIGRDVELCEAADLVAAHRLVTLTGPGGIGKTRLGVEVARRLLPDFFDGVWIAELAPLREPGLLAETVATTLGLEPTPGLAPLERIAAALGSMRLLLVLDNCEHMVGAAADMAEALLRASPAIHVLVTSREPLRAEGEQVFPVPPLAVPAEGNDEAEGVLTYGAIRLFLDRARAAAPDFTVDTPRAAVIAAICRNLDGIPLAIELAAARTAVFSLDEIAARLDDRFQLLTGGRRTALPRHQTLRATLDWSYDLLTEPERRVLRRIAIFAGSFSLEAAGAVAGRGEPGVMDVVDCVANLVAKSLLVADPGGAATRFRLLQTMRAYALEKLTDSGERGQAAGRHAEYHRDLFERAEAELATRSSDDWWAAYGRRIDDVRAALDWAFSPGGNAATGIALTAVAVPLWFQSSSLEECRLNVERALSSLGPGSGKDTRREMQLLAALGASLNHTKGPVRESEAAWTRVLTIAEGLDDVAYQVQALHGMWSYRNNNGEFGIALTLARRFRQLAADRADPTDVVIGDRMIGVVLHHLGDQVGARRHLERALDAGGASAHRSASAVRSLLDHRARARCTLARVLWIQGFPDQATRTAERALGEARSSIDHVTSQCYVLAQAAATVALLTGDLTAADRFVAMLVRHSAKHALAVWHARGRCFEAALLIARGDRDRGARRLRAALGAIHHAGSALYCMGFLTMLAEGLGGAGRIADGLAVIDDALACSERVAERWCVTELLRIKGALLLSEGAPGAAAAAEACFMEGLDWARRQDALSWELRAATSLARLWQHQGRAGEARALLAAVYGRFTEGYETADLRAARSLIEQLG